MLISKQILSLLIGACFMQCCKNNKPGHNQYKVAIPLETRQDSTPYYTYKIILPDTVTDSLTASTLRHFVSAQKDSFMSMLPKDTSDYRVVPWQLRIESKKVFESTRFKAYQAQVYQYTGGAHGRPSLKIFTLDKKENQLISLPAIFQDSIALKPISQYATNEIVLQIYKKPSVHMLNGITKKWLTEGAAPNYKNYSIFYPAQKSNSTASGIEIVFSAYQVGPYSIGMPKVFIPDSVFYEYLKTEYRSAFTNPE